MSRRDIMDTTLGEMMDMLACFYVTHGVAKEVTRQYLDYDDAIKLR